MLEFVEGFALTWTLCLVCAACGDSGGKGNDADAGVVEECAEVPASNLAPSPGFEELETSWLLPESESTSVRMSTDVVHAGSVALRVTFDGAAEWRAETAAHVPVSSSAELVFSGYVQSSGFDGQVRFVIEELDGLSDQVATHESDPIRGDTGWTESSITFTTTATTEALGVAVVVEPWQQATVTGVLYLDDLLASPSAGMSPMVSNGGFDQDLTDWGWHQVEPNYVFHDTTVYRTAPGAIRLDPTSNATNREAWNIAARGVIVGQVVHASGWTRTDPGDYPTSFSGSLINIDFREPSPEERIHGTSNAVLMPWGLDEWSFSELTDVVDPAETRVCVALGAFPREHAGSAWFDDIDVKLLDLMPNPGFEYFRPVGWGSLSGDNAQWSSRLDVEVRHCGQVSLRVDFHGLPSIYDYLLEAIPRIQVMYGIVGNATEVEPGSTVHLRGYIKTEDLSTPTGFELAEYDIIGADLNPPRRGPHNPTDTVQGTHDWTLVERTITLTPDTHYVVVRIRAAIAAVVGAAGAQPISGTAWYDDVWLTVE